MSSLPPAGRGIIAGAEPERGFGTESLTFGRNSVERRSGILDRRAEVSPGGRRKGEDERRKETAASRVAESGNLRDTVQTSGEKQPVHLEDEQGRLQPNPAAPVTGVSDIERLTDAASKGVPFGTKEIEDRGVPGAGVVLPTRLRGSTLDRESGKVVAGMGEVDSSEAKKPEPEKTKSEEELRDQTRQASEIYHTEPFEKKQEARERGEIVDPQLAMGQVSQPQGTSERRHGQRRFEVKPIDHEDRRTIGDRRRMAPFSDQIGHRT